MNHSQTRTASLLLAFGSFFVLFSACSTLFQSIDSGDTEEAYIDGRYSDALAGANELLKENPDNADLLLIKAGSLNQLAAERDRSDERSDYYREMRHTLNQVGDITSSEEHLEKRDKIIAESWNREHSAGLDFFYEAPVPGSDAYWQMMNHFENALLANPQGSDSYAMKVTLHYQEGELDQALSTMEEANRELNQLPFELKEKFAYLLLEAGELEESITLYTSLLEQQPGHFDVKHGLVNALILVGDHEASVQHLRDLVETEPDNYVYHKALATELFFYVETSFGNIDRENLPEEEVSEAQRFVMDQLIEAENHYQAVRELHPNPDEISYEAAAFYKNMARHLMQAADQQSDETGEELETMAKELLTRSLPVWQEVADRNPENPDIWKSMFQIYSQLEMEDEAEEARSRANL